MVNRRIECSIRCLDPGTVAAVRAGLSNAPVSAVPYVCKVSGRAEQAILVSEELAERISDRVSTLPDPLDVVLAAATLRAQLCECDLATLAGKPESEVLARLDRLDESEIVTRERIHGMNYYRIAAGRTRDAISAILAPYLEKV